ncbi:MAG: response regulator transcription factor [Caldilineaceae bacterium]
MSKLRILLVDDHAMLRTGLQMVVNSQPDMEVVGQASSGAEALVQAQACQPDLVVMDISLPGLNGVEATEAIRQRWPEMRVLVFTRHDDPGYLRRLLHAGATGYLLKNAAANDLVNAIRVVAAGGAYVDPSLVSSVVESLTHRAAALAPPLGELTSREREVLHLIAWGQSNKEIAAQLGISVKTVEYYKAQATEKLHLHSRTDIVRYALIQGWLNPNEAPE